MIESKSKLSIDNNEYYIHADELELLTEKSLLYAYGNININSELLMLNAQKMIGNFKENKILFYPMTLTEQLSIPLINFIRQNSLFTS